MWECVWRGVVGGGECVQVRCEWARGGGSFFLAADCAKGAALHGWRGVVGVVAHLWGRVLVHRRRKPHLRNPTLP
eukprot:scaffold25888_cov45-Isochrysis_galbana.AAC.1